MPGSIRLGKIAGIDIYIHVSWLIIVVLLTWSLDIQFSASYPGWGTATYWVVSLIATLLLFAAVLLHELAHSVVARARGLSVKNITLYIWGGLSNIEQEPRSPGIEFQMAVVGPATNLLIAGLAYLLLLALGKGTSPVTALLGYLALANLLLGLFNLIPGFPLDGGRVLRSIVWKVSGNLRTATRVTTLVGQIVAYLFIFWGIWQFFLGNVLGGIWIGFIGWFLLSAGQSANSQVMLQSMFRGVKVSEVMNPSPMTTPANISLQKLVYDYLLPGGVSYALVMQGDRLAGLIKLSDIRHIPQEEWGQVPVGHAMIPLEKLHIVTPQQSLNDVLPLMAGRDVNQLPVVQDDHLVGLLSRDAIIHFIEVRRGLGLDTGA